MLTHIRNWLAPPVFADDEERTRTARVLNTLMITMMLFILFLGGVIIPFVFVEKFYTAIFALTAFLALAIAYWQMRRGRVRLASAIWTSLMWIAFTATLAVAGGMTSILAVFYIATTVITGLLLGTRAALIHGLACSLAGLGMLILETSGHPLPRVFPMPATTGWVDLTLCLALTITTLSITLRDLNDALTLARRQIEERKRAEEALRESEEKFSKAFHSSPLSITITRMPDGQFVETNQTFEILSGYSRDEVIDRTSLDLGLINSEDRKVGQRTLKECGSFRNMELKFYTKLGEERIGLFSGDLMEIGEEVCLIQVVSDITERKRAEKALRESHHRLEVTLAELKDTQEQMVHQERLAAVGQLAAGIAHDFNNILATIVLYTQMSLRSAELSPKVRQRLEIIAQETGRASDLVQQILDFSRRTVLERRPVALDSFMKEIIKLLQRTLPESIQVDLNFGPGEYIINADPTRIQQTIVNLALNARDAMPSGGELHITLSKTKGREIQCVGCGLIIGGEWVQVAITDTGTGIAPDVLPHIFEPFFTTRAPLGHGLGLSQVYGIVKQHNGHIEMETEVGQGTTFRLYWPVPAIATPPVESKEPAEVIQGLGETILVVEDNVTMRASLKDALEMLDYRVLEATNGQEALEVCEQHAEEIALVLSDWVMPSMGGMELVHELASLHTGMNVLLFTGHPLSQEVKKAVPPNVVGWLLKPPSLEQLAKAVSQAIDKDSG